MNHPTVYGTSGIRELPPTRFYVYGGTVPLEKDPDIHKSMTHGTASAARLHYLRGEKPCPECKESERARWMARTEARRTKRQAEKEAGNAGSDS